MLECDPASWVVPVIRLGQELGQIRPGNPSALASVFYGTLRAIAEHHAHFPDDPLPEQAWVMDLITARGGERRTDIDD